MNEGAEESKREAKKPRTRKREKEEDRIGRVRKK